MSLRTTAVATLTLAAIAASLALSGCSKVGDTIKIGVAQPLSGPLAPLGKDMLNGVKLAVDEMNKAGVKIDGHPVKLEVVSADDKANADEGKKAAQTLVDAGVIAVVGDLNSGVSMAAAPIYAEHNIPQLAISTKPEYTKLGFETTYQQNYVHKDKGKVRDLHFQKNGTDLFNGWKSEECAANLAAIDALFGNVGIKITPRVMSLAEAYA